MSTPVDSPDPFSGKSLAISYFGGSEKFYAKHFARFAKKYEHIDDDIAALIEAGDLTEAHRLTHSLKGICLTLGLTPLGEAAYALEQELLHPVDINNSLTILRTRVKQLFAAINN